MDALHDGLQALFGVLEGPRVAARVLLHLERGSRHAAGIGRLAGSKGDPGLLKHAHTTGCGRHVGALGDRPAAVADKGAGRGFIELVLRRARQRDVARDVPDPAAREILRIAVLVCIVRNAAALDLLQALDEREVDAALVQDHAVRIRACDHPTAEFLQLLDGVDRDIAGARHDADLALDRFAAGFQHLVDEKDSAIAGRLAPHE